MSVEFSFSSNYEYMSQLEGMGRDIFVAAFEREHQQNIPPDFQEKPLDALILTVGRLTINPPELPHVLVKESIDLQPVSSPDRMPPDAILGTETEDVIKRYKAWEQVGPLVMTNELKVDQLAQESVEGRYVGIRRNAEEIAVGTLDESSSTMRIVSVLDFATAAKQYVTSPLFPPTKEQLLEFLRRRHGMATSPETVFYHQWSIEQRDDLPLTGNESAEFLTAHYEFLSNRIEATRIEVRMLERFRRDSKEPQIRLAQLEDKKQFIDLVLPRQNPEG